MSKLTEKQRARRDEKILNLYHVKGMSTRAIAAKLGTIGKTRVAEICKG